MLDLKSSSEQIFSENCRWVLLFCRELSLRARTMQVLFVLWFYHPDKTDKIDRLLRASSLEMAVKMSSAVYIKIVSSYRWL